MHLRSHLACGLLLVGCEIKPSGVPSNPDIDRLEACARDITAIKTATPPERSKVMAAHLTPAAGECLSIVVAGCEVEPMDSTSSTAMAGQMDAQRRLCVERVCPELEQRPRLCDDPDATTAGTKDEVVELLTEFLAAKLAKQLGLERDDSRVQEVARAYAWTWAAPISLSRIRVSPPRYAPPAD